MSQRVYWLKSTVFLCVFIMCVCVCEEGRGGDDDDDDDVSAGD